MFVYYLCVWKPEDGSEELVLLLYFYVSSGPENRVWVVSLSKKCLSFPSETPLQASGVLFSFLHWCFESVVVEVCHSLCQIHS